MTDKNKTNRIHWDPFSGEVAHRVDALVKPPETSDLQQKRTIAAAILGLFLFVVGANLERIDLQLLGAPLLFGGGLVFAIATPSAEDRLRYMHQRALACLASELGAACRLLLPIRVVVAPQRHSPGPAELQDMAKKAFADRPDLKIGEAQIARMAAKKWRAHKGKPSVPFVDPDEFAVTSSLGTFLAPGPAVAIPFHPEALYWWDTDATPIWLAAQIVKHDVRNPVLVSKGSPARSHSFCCVFGTRLKHGFTSVVHIKAKIPAFQSQGKNSEKNDFHILFEVSQTSEIIAGPILSITATAQDLMVDMFRRTGAEFMLDHSTLFVRCVVPLTLDTAAPEGCSADLAAAVGEIGQDVMRLKDQILPV